MVSLKNGLCALLIAATGSTAIAKDFGTHGPVWEIIEPSILETIKARLNEMESSGALAEMQQEMQDTTY